MRSAIRKYRPSDLAALWPSAFRAYLGSTWGRFDTTHRLYDAENPEWFSRLAARCAQNGVALVHWVDGKPVAFSAGEPFFQSMPDAEIREMVNQLADAKSQASLQTGLKKAFIRLEEFTDPNFQGHGYQRVLTSKLESEAKRQGYLEIVSWTLDHPENPQGAIFLRQGYTCLGTYRKSGDERPRTLWVKAL